MAFIDELGLLTENNTLPKRRLRSLDSRAQYIADMTKAKILILASTGKRSLTYVPMVRYLNYDDRSIERPFANDWNSKDTPILEDTNIYNTLKVDFDPCSFEFKYYGQGKVSSQEEENKAFTYIHLLDIKDFCTMIEEKMISEGFYGIQAAAIHDIYRGGFLNLKKYRDRYYIQISAIW